MSRDNFDTLDFALQTNTVNKFYSATTQQREMRCKRLRYDLRCNTINALLVPKRCRSGRCSDTGGAHSDKCEKPVSQSSERAHIDLTRRR